MDSSPTPAISGSFFVRGSRDYSFPGELAFFEVQQQCQFQARDVKVAEHLSRVGFVESCDHFWVHYDLPVHDEIRHELSDEVASVVNRVFTLLFDSMAARHQLDY